MPRKNDHNYAAVLFRGWEIVRLDYRLRDDDVLVTERHTWHFGKSTEKSVPLEGLTGEVRRIFARQTAYWFSIFLLVGIFLVLAADLVFFKGGMQGERGIYWPLWGPGIVVATLCWWVMWKTRKPIEWTMFKPQSGRQGLYVLRNMRDLDGHAHFVAAVSKRLPSS